MPRKILIKTPEQIDGIRRSSRLAADVLIMIEPYIRPGISTSELDHICNNYILTHGGRSACIGYHGFPRYTCISRNDIICHGIPSETECLQDGDIVNVDVTTIVDGYYGDTSRMYLVGEVSDAAKKLSRIAEECLMLGIDQVRPGAKFGDIGYVVARHAEKAGYSVVREYTGHGVGIEFHEEPYIYHRAPKGSGDTMREGMTFTIEPMINMGNYHTHLSNEDGWTVRTTDGSLSAQWEHTILVTADGYDILTTRDR